MRAVILVAGTGSRLCARTSAVPKCLLDVNGVPILLNALECLERAKVFEAVLVVGYLDSVIRDRVGAGPGQMRVSYRTNADYQSTSTSRSLWAGLEGVDEDVLALEGDVYFDVDVIDQFLTAPYGDATLVEPWNPTLDGSVVELDSGRTVRAWVHKKDRPPNFRLEGTYKTVNVHRFSRAFLRERLLPALAAEVARGGREPIETVFARIVAEGGRIHAVDVRSRWVEIDDEHDLRTAEATFRGSPA